jgi:hypothetical protein
LQGVEGQQQLVINPTCPAMSSLKQQQQQQQQQQQAAVISGTAL